MARSRRSTMPEQLLRERALVRAKRREEERQEPFRRGWLREAQIAAGHLDPGDGLGPLKPGERWVDGRRLYSAAWL